MICVIMTRNADLETESSTPNWQHKMEELFWWLRYITNKVLCNLPLHENLVAIDFVVVRVRNTPAIEITIIILSSNLGFTQTVIEIKQESKSVIKCTTPSSIQAVVDNGRGHYYLRSLRLRSDTMVWH